MNRLFELLERLLPLLEQAMPMFERDLQEYIRRGGGQGPSPAPVPDEPEPDEPEDHLADDDVLAPERETEQEAKARMERWYPNIRRGGKTKREQDGFQGPPNNTLNWKPQSENDKKLVVLLPSRVRVVSLQVPGGETKSVAAQSISNGHRLTVRFSKPGGAYPAGPLRAKLADGNYMLADVTTTAKQNRSLKWWIAPDAQKLPEPDAVNPPVLDGEFDFVGYERNPQGYISLRLTPAMEASVIRLKFIYDDHDNDGRPFINMRRTVNGIWQSVEPCPMKGRHGFLVNSKIGQVKFPVRWSGVPGLTRLNNKPEAHPTYGDTFGAYFVY